MEFLLCIMYYYNIKCGICQVILVEIDKSKYEPLSFDLNRKLTTQQDMSKMIRQERKYRNELQIYYQVGRLDNPFVGSFKSLSNRGRSHQRGGIAFGNISRIRI